MSTRETRPPYRNTSSRNTGSQSRASSSRGGRPSVSRNQEVDRYNYVDRDIYSRSDRGGQPSYHSPRRRKRHSGLKKFAMVACSFLLVAALGAAAWAGVLFSRLNREEASTESYVQQPSAAPAWDVIHDDKVTNILLLGTDNGGDGLSSRSDTTMLISIDNKTQSVRMVSFLRDLYLEIPTVGMGRLNTAFNNGGPALTMQTLENNFRISVDKYIQIDFDGLVAIIDRLGGIDVDMSEAAVEVTNQDMKSNLTPGVNHLDGRLALYYVRIRNIDSDFGRTQRQQQVLKIIMDQCKTKNPLEISALAYDFLPYVTTNLSESDLSYLISIAPQVMSYEVDKMHVPDDTAYTDLTLPSGAMVLDPDLEENCRLLREFLYDSPSPSASSTEP